MELGLSGWWLLKAQWAVNKKKEKWVGLLKFGPGLCGWMVSKKKKKRKGAVARTRERETEKGTVHKLGHSPKF